MSEQSQGNTPEGSSPQDLKEIIANLYLDNEKLKKSVLRTESLERQLRDALDRISELEDALRTLGSSEVSNVTEVRKIVVACLKTPPSPKGKGAAGDSSGE